jgi:hypothetical protein
MLGGPVAGPAHKARPRLGPGGVAASETHVTRPFESRRR